MCGAYVVDVDLVVPAEYFYEHLNSWFTRSCEMNQIGKTKYIKYY